MKPTHSVRICRFLVHTLLILLPAAGWAQRVTATVPVGTNPVAVAVNPVTNKIYVANCVKRSGRSLPTGTVTVIDGNTNVTTDVPVGICPSAVAVNPVTNKIYIANFGSFCLIGNWCINYGSVTVIDGATNHTITITDPNAKNPRAVAVNPVTNKIYVANNLSQNVTVIDGASNSIKTVPLTGTYPYDIAVDTTTNQIYVTNFLFGSVAGSKPIYVIDGFTSRSTTVTDPKAADPFAVAVNSVTNKIYVVNRQNGTNVGSGTVIDGATNSTTNIADLNGPHAVVVNPISNRIYLANANNAGINGNGGVTVVDGFTNSFLTVTDPNASTECNVFDTGNVAVDTIKNRVYVANACSNNITVLDGFTNLTTTIADPNATNPKAVAVNPVTGKVYVVNSVSNNLTVIDDGSSAVTPTAAKADFNADGRADLLWRQGGVVGLWEMNGVTSLKQLSLTPTMDPVWNLVGTGDLDGDGKPEVVWQNTDGRLAAWFMSGETVQRSMDLSPNSPGSTEWKVVALADMNRDGKADLIWQHDNGWLGVWLVNGVNTTSWAYLTPSNVGNTRWRIVGAGDLNGDGQPDLVWQRSDGWLGAWIMNGSKVASWLYLTPNRVDPNWKIGLSST